MGSRPMVMPDGRSLAEWISESEKRALVSERVSTKKKGRAGKRANQLERAWESAAAKAHPSSMSRSCPQRRAPPPPPGGDGQRMGRSYEEQMQDESFSEYLSQFGARRRNRWANEQILRDLAGPMSAEEMRGLFAPVPFGQPAPPSAFECAMMDKELAELLRQADMDDEMDAMFHMEISSQREKRRGDVSASGSAKSDTLPDGSLSREGLLRGLEAWSNVAHKARKALRRGSQQSWPSMLRLEAKVIQFLEASLAGTSHPPPPSTNPPSAAPTSTLSSSPPVENLTNGEAWTLVDADSDGVDSAGEAAGGGQGDRDKAIGDEDVVQSRAPSPDRLVLTLADPFQRLVLHGLCSFHGLSCNSMPDVASGKRITVIRRTLHTPPPQAHSCARFLQEVSCLERKLGGFGLDEMERLVY
eukprot:CAMPEP_0197854160 /NCGR_PEP_ID=MMETSP1438-20131217/24130_1 /TAXON_ID=1461541 /ORGANISM="Pterosperma sp., Strain CCMP1384" /LENGTH=414 /DNA_ID=CAMNT_0043468807 /DNA_START=107 /DNA_END=1351 /DNA_ORIENTATION=+